MLRILLAGMLALGMAGPLRAQTGEPTAVIAAQIEAFKRDDFETAFGLASPAIRDVFQSHERFEQMVRQGFPMVWRPAQVQYLGQRSAAGFTYQKVLIEDLGGGLHLLEYELLPGAQGWRINGVQFLAPPAVGA